MYGLEKSPKDKFDFDLEIDMKENPSKAKEMLAKVESTINALKNALRKGDKKENLDKLGILLQGYVALLKVLKKIQKS